MEDRKIVATKKKGKKRKTERKIRKIPDALNRKRQYRPPAYRHYSLLLRPPLYYYFYYFFHFYTIDSYFFLLSSPLPPPSSPPLFPSHVVTFLLFHFLS